MKHLLPLLAAVAAGACADAPPHDVTVTWSLNDVTVGNYCTRVSVSIGHDARPVEEHTLACDATSDVITVDDGEAATIEVHYMYWEIPAGCESQSCWHETWFASGYGTYDGASDQMAITVHRSF
ncbi:MAG TPA: hypothetical protein VMZ53_09095 [Kofleriaceae bacterium]|nr:hypothetical protein [Kofleriaceae bacterium]